MSRSYKTPIIKDKPRNANHASTYWRPVRRVINQAVRNGVEALPDPKSIVNDYDYSEYKYDFTQNLKGRFYTQEDLERDKIKYSRK